MGNSEDLVIVNTLMRQALTAVEEVIGRNGGIDITKTSFEGIRITCDCFRQEE
jgi:hypothetical protein